MSGIYFKLGIVLHYSLSSYAHLKISAIKVHFFFKSRNELFLITYPGIAH